MRLPGVSSWAPSSPWGQHPASPGTLPGSRFPYLGGCRAGAEVSGPSDGAFWGGEDRDLLGPSVASPRLASQQGLRLPVAPLASAHGCGVPVTAPSPVAVAALWHPPPFPPWVRGASGC